MRVLICRRGRFAGFGGDGVLNVAPGVLASADALLDMIRHLLQFLSRPSTLIVHNPSSNRTNYQ